MQKYYKLGDISMSQLNSVPKTNIDARKFLATINKGYNSQLKLVENKLNGLGKEYDTDFRLVSYNYNSSSDNSVMFEDVNTNKYYRAEIEKNNRNIKITNISELSIVDKEKPKVFENACRQLIDAIEEENTSSADKILNKIKQGNCISRAIPLSGIAKTRDGSYHKISATNSIIPEDIYPRVVSCLKEAINKSKVVKEGVIQIGDSNLNLPINETTRRLSVARQMKQIAEEAYNSNNFRRLVKNIAGYISNDSISEAIKLAKDFLMEMQEFCMLDKKGMTRLVENTLYAQGIWNYYVSNNTANLMYETNCHINKNDILEQWKLAAIKSKNKNLLENVEILSESTKSPKAFSDTYDSFLSKLFNEDTSSKSVKARAYLNMLSTLRSVVDGSDADAAVQSSVDDLIMRLESDPNNVDDATIFEVENLLATISTDLLRDTASLSDFDRMPEPQSVDQFGSETDEMVGEFEGDMGDFGGEGGFGDIGAEGDLGDLDVEAEVDIEDKELGEPDAEIEADIDIEDEEEDELQLAHVIHTSKPISEMQHDDIKRVVESIKHMKPEKVEIEDDEFKALLNSGLTEDQKVFIRNVMDRSKELDSGLFEDMASLYFDLAISEDNDNTDDDRYDLKIENDVSVNEDYTGINEEDEEDEEDPHAAALARKGDDEDPHAAALARKGDEDDHVDESIAVVADDDEALLSIIDKVLGNKGDDQEGDDQEGDDQEGDEELIVDQDDEDPHAAALARKDGDEEDGDEDPHAAALARKDGDDEDEEEDEEDEEDEDDEELDPSIDPDGDGIPIWKDEDDQAMKEDNNITDPSSSGYTSEKDAEKNKKPKFSDTDYEGRSAASTGKQSPNAGLSSATKKS